MSCTREEFVNEGKRWLGVNERNGTFKVIIDGYNEIRPLPRGYRLQYTDAWCAAFVTFIAKRCNALDIIPPECSCGKMVIAGGSMGIFLEHDDYRPKLGDIIFYDWQDNGKGDCTGYPDHVGIVSQLTATTFDVIEGNYNNEVGIRHLGFNARYIRGFLSPRFDEALHQVHEETDLDKLAMLVIRGDYGNGRERISRLTKLGYEPSEVQARVNQILSR